MMENLHHHRADFSPVYDLEFYSSTPNSSARGWKDAGNNNNISSDAESGFSINVSTGESELFIDDLIELTSTDENMSANSSLSAVSTPSPVIPVAKRSIPLPTTELIPQPQYQQRIAARPLASAPTTLPYHSRLHEALTQPRLPTQPVKCNRCGQELTSKCLMQTCEDDTRCRTCGDVLTAKCILLVCTHRPQPQDPQTVEPTRKRVHHYSNPQ